MKTKILLALTLFCFLSLAVEAQRGIRIGYIDMEYILENVPEYKEATSQLETKVQKWKSEIEIKLAEVDDMKKELHNERVLLTKELVEEREEDIFFKEKEILDYQQSRFGPAGDLVIQKKQLVQPVQDQVFNAVQEIATTKKYDFVFDKSADVVMLYSADRHDISDLILRNISRAAKRQQVKSKKQKQEIEEEEYLSVQQAEEVDKRKKLIEEKKAERQRLIEEKKAEREALKKNKLEEFNDKKAKLLKEREQLKDSLIKVREEKLQQLKSEKEEK